MIGQHTPQSPPLLRVRRLSKYFSAVEALVDVDLVVRQHEVVALVGDNAAGKTTLAKVVAGAFQPSGGAIEIDGRPTRVDSPAVAFQQGVATVFQELGLCENLDVVANIFLGRELHEETRLLDEIEMERRAREYVDALGSRIPDIRAPLSSLSAGQRQCVAIARTLVGKPRLVVLDEPTASLSVGQTAEVLTHIERLRTLGLGVIFISHSLSDVRAVADRIEVLRHGRNNGSFDARRDSYEQVVAAITGATRVKQPRDQWRRHGG